MDAFYGGPRFGTNNFEVRNTLEWALWLVSKLNIKEEFHDLLAEAFLEGSVVYSKLIVNSLIPNGKCN